MWIICLVVFLGLQQPFAQVEATYGYTTDNGNIFLKILKFPRKKYRLRKEKILHNIINNNYTS